jgi:hypothetical protein
LALSSTSKLLPFHDFHNGCSFLYLYMDFNVQVKFLK